MNETSVQYEYSYQNSSAGHHHNYLIPPLLQLLGNQKKTTNHVAVLDLGCGNGSLSNAIATQGYQVTGVEESASGVKLAQKQYPNCHFMEGSIYDLPYNQLDAQFDVVISAEVIEHLFYPKELVKAAKKCLKPGGKLILTTPYHGYLKNLALAITGKMDAHHTVLWDGGHIKFFSVKTLTRLLEEQDAKDIKFKFAGRYKYLWKSMLCSCVFD